MFYRPQDGHGLPHNPFTAIVTPRPIGWISTRGKNGRNNLAPYSFFNGVAYAPPQVKFASTADKEDRHFGKDSVANIDETGVFCVNIVEYAMREAMNRTSGSYSAEVEEFELAGLEKTECTTIACSRVAAGPAALECRLSKMVKLKGDANVMVIGEVTGIYLRDDCLVDGRYDVTTYRPLSRLGYRDYSVVDNIFSLARPDD
ncbi:MAG: flavin reductase family protein [Paracoccaceae bacterium]